MDKKGAEVMITYARRKLLESIRAACKDSGNEGEEQDGVKFD
jgi:hypothetical protein